MKITKEWLESVQDEHGLTRGQEQLLAIWKARLRFVGYDHLPDQVAHVIKTCKGYRGIPKDVAGFFSDRRFLQL